MQSNQIKELQKQIEELNKLLVSKDSDIEELTITMEARCINLRDLSIQLQQCQQALNAQSASTAPLVVELAEAKQDNTRQLQERYAAGVTDGKLIVANKVKNRVTEIRKLARIIYHVLDTQLQKTISDKEATNTKNGYYTQHLKLTLEEAYREIGALKQELELAARDYSRAIKLSWGVTLFMFLYATTLSLHEAGLLPYSLGG